MKTCENCGSRVYGLGCTWCNEEAYIEQQQHFDDLHERDRKAEQRAGLSDEPPRFCDLSAQEQRSTIEEWWTQKTYQQGLLGEAVNEHRLYPEIRAAFVAGDTAELGRLVDQAVREYCGEVMELDQ